MRAPFPHCGGRNPPFGELRLAMTMWRLAASPAAHRLCAIAKDVASATPRGTNAAPPVVLPRADRLDLACSLTSTFPDAQTRTGGTGVWVRARPAHGCGQTLVVLVVARRPRTGRRRLATHASRPRSPLTPRSHAGPTAGRACLHLLAIDDV